MTEEKFSESVATFFRERLEFYLKDVRGYAYDVVKAVLAADAEDVVDALQRAEAVKQVLHMPEFQAIGAACKRMRNILRQAAEKGIEPAAQFEYLPESAEEEKTLMAYMERTGARVEAHRSRKEYLEALLLLSTAREPVDRVLRQGDGDGRRPAGAGEPAGAAADVVEGVLHDRGFFRDRDRREGVIFSRPSGTCS